MRKAILAMLVLLLIQLRAWAGSDSVIVEAPAGIKAAALAEQFGGTAGNPENDGVAGFPVVRPAACVEADSRR